MAQRLQSKGYTKEQAEGFVETLQELNMDSFATKEDMRELKSAMREQGLQLKLNIGAMIFTLGGVLIAVKFIS